MESYVLPQPITEARKRRKNRNSNSKKIRTFQNASISSHGSQDEKNDGEPYVGMEPVTSQNSRVGTTRQTKRHTRYATRTFQMDSQKPETAEAGPRSTNFHGSLSSSRRSSALRLYSGSALRWELQSKDSHLGNMMKSQARIEDRYEKEKRYATVYEEFQKEKQSVRDYKDRFRMH